MQIENAIAGLINMEVSNWIKQNHFIIEREREGYASMALSQTGSLVASPPTSLLVLESKSPFIHDMVGLSLT